jgi:hypothetical protein
MNTIDTQKMDIQCGCKSRSRKLKKLYLPFSLPVRSVHKQPEAYTNLMRWHEGKSRNSHIIHDVIKAGVTNLRGLSATQCMAGIAACKWQLKNLELKVDQL